MKQPQFHAALVENRLLHEFNLSGRVPLVETYREVNDVDELSKQNVRRRHIDENSLPTVIRGMDGQVLDVH